LGSWQLHDGVRLQQGVDVIQVVFDPVLIGTRMFESEWRVRGQRQCEVVVVTDVLRLSHILKDMDYVS